MKQTILSILIILFFSMTSCLENEKKEIKKTTTNVNVSEKKEIIVQLEPKNKSAANGKLIFKEFNGIVKLEAKFMNLSPGIHAIHRWEKLAKNSWSSIKDIKNQSNTENWYCDTQDSMSCCPYNYIA